MSRSIETGTGGKSLSILGPDLAISGTVESAGDIQIDGHLEGQARAQTLTLSENASMTGDAAAETIEVRGALTGNIFARRVRLTSSAQVKGDIVHASLEMEAGARFDGYCRRADDPLALADKPAASGPAPRPAQTPAPAPAPKPKAKDEPPPAEAGKETPPAS